VAIYDSDGAELSAGLDIAQTDDKGVDVAVSLVMWLDAGESRMLRWEADAPAPRALGAVSQDAFDDMAFATVLTECGGTAQGAALTLGGVEVDDRQAMAHVQRAGTLPMCDETGTVVHTLRRHDGLPGVVVSVDAQLPDVVDPESLESIALSVFSCGDGVESIQWQTFGGQVRTRPMRPGVETWNGQSVDGWMGFSCADGQNIQLSHRVKERSSLGLAPLRDRGGATMIAPLGTLWGDSPWHGARRTGGSGMGDVITALVGSQYRPAAPDWSGQSVSYRLLVGDGSIDVGTLDLFAHPPLVRVP
jgi:hypothetical protein